MSLTGSLHIVTDEELESLISNDFKFIENLNEDVDLSYFAIDFLEILSKYSHIDRTFIGKILQGDNFFQPVDGFIGYSNSNEVKANKIETLDKISELNFSEYLRMGENENSPHTPVLNQEFLLKYFKNIKKGYENAVNEGNALVFKIG